MDCAREFRSRHAEMHRNLRFLAPPETPFPCEPKVFRAKKKIRNADSGAFATAEKAVPVVEVQFIPPIPAELINAKPPGGFFARKF